MFSSRVVLQNQRSQILRSERGCRVEFFRIGDEFFGEDLMYFILDGVTGKKGGAMEYIADIEVLMLDIRELLYAASGFFGKFTLMDFASVLDDINEMLSKYGVKVGIGDFEIGEVYAADRDIDEDLINLLTKRGQWYNIRIEDGHDVLLDNREIRIMEGRCGADQVLASIDRWFGIQLPETTVIIWE